MEHAADHLRKYKELWNKATPPLTKAELDAANERCRAVNTLLRLVDKSTKQPDDFIKDHAQALSDTGLSNDDVKMMFRAVALKATITRLRAHGKGSATIPTAERLGLGEGSLKAYIRRPSTWGEHRAAWQRKAVMNMPNNLAARIEQVVESNGGTALSMPVITEWVNQERAKKPMPSIEALVKAVAKKNNPHEQGYAEDVWKIYVRLYGQQAEGNKK